MSFDWEAHREKLVDEQTEFLMSAGQEYYPFSVENFTEALQNLSDSQYFRLAIYAASFDQDHENPFTARLYSVCMNSVAEEYWRKIATDLSEKETISAEEMRLNAEKYIVNVRGF